MIRQIKIETKAARRPVQASDYGKPDQKISDSDIQSQNTNTDGRKVLALWRS